MNHNTYFFLLILITGLTGCTKQSIKPTPVDNLPNLPEVIQYDRYILANIAPMPEQQQVLEQIIDIKIPVTLSVSVGEAMDYALKQSGYQRCHDNDQTRYLFPHPLPAIHYQLGPIRLSEALQIMAGNAWEMTINDVTRTLCFQLAQGYTTPTETLPVIPERAQEPQASHHE